MTYFSDSPARAGLKADALIAAEVTIQDKMWGVNNDRADADQGQMRMAAVAQLMLVTLKDSRGFDSPNAIATAKAAYYPEDWNGFRDYGTKVANLVVAAAFIRSEIKRLLILGEDFTRAPREGSYPHAAPNVSSEEAGRAPDGAIDAHFFLQGRAAYAEKTPVYELATALKTAEARGDDDGFALLVGYLDGLVQDVRDSAQAARSSGL